MIVFGKESVTFDTRNEGKNLQIKQEWFSKKIWFSKHELLEICEENAQELSRRAETQNPDSHNLAEPISTTTVITNYLKRKETLKKE